MKKKLREADISELIDIVHYKMKETMENIAYYHNVTKDEYSAKLRVKYMKHLEELEERLVNELGE